MDESLITLFIKQCSKFPDRNLYGILKPSVSWITYIRALNMTISLVEYIKGNAVTAGNITIASGVVGVYSINRYECMLAEHAIHMLGKTSCNIHGTTTIDNFILIMNETEIDTCFMSRDGAIFISKNNLLQKLPFLRHAIVFSEDEIDEEYVEAFNKAGVKIHDFDRAATQETAFYTELSKKGVTGINNEEDQKKKSTIKKCIAGEQENIHRITDQDDIFKTIMKYITERLKLCLPKRSDVAILCYTSGTTGNPKGAMITHANFLSFINAFDDDERLFQVRKEDVHLSYLPLAHVMEKAVSCMLISRGASIGFYTGNYANIADDLRVLKPTIFIAVPKILDRIRKAISKKISDSNTFVKKLYELENKRGAAFIMNALSINIVSKKIRKTFGGRIRACLSGGSRLDPDLCKEMEGMLGCEIFQGYGQTETTGCVCMKPVGRREIVDTVGMPIRCNQIRIIHGELQIKGETVFKGYYKHDDLTKKTFTDDGWFKTGDIASIQDGLVRIVDRKSDIFKISNGEYISPDNLESLLAIDEAKDIFVTRSPESDGIYVVVFGNAPDLVNLVESRAKLLLAENRIKGYEIPKKIIAVASERFNEIEKYYTYTAKKQRNKLFNRLVELDILEPRK